MDESALKYVLLRLRNGADSARAIRSNIWGRSIHACYVHFGHHHQRHPQIRTNYANPRFQCVFACQMGKYTFLYSLPTLSLCSLKEGLIKKYTLKQGDSLKMNQSEIMLGNYLWRLKNFSHQAQSL